MADWRQIQARIRKAKNAADPLAKLSELYLRTRDAMVAWELGTIYEKNGHTEEAVKWYKAAWERFRRADWKKKAEEALTRMGAEVPEKGAAAAAHATAAHSEEETERDAQPAEEQAEEMESPSEREESEAEPPSAAAPAASAGASAGGQDALRGKRRRGRRGGRGRHRRGDAPPAAGGKPQGLPPRIYAEPGAADAPAYRHANHAASERAAESPAPREFSRSAPVAAEPPMLPSERAAHGHRDPGLASRMAHLESMLRRLVASPLHKLDAVDEAPAGPGVFLLSDSDQTGYYYVEACQTLRVGLGNLVRGGGKGNRGSGSRGGARNYSDTDLKSRLAEHLEINESKVSQYLKDHCVVRWIQLDEEAPHLAHFAIGVLRTPLNAD